MVFVDTHAGFRYTGESFFNRWYGHTQRAHAHIDYSVWFHFRLLWSAVQPGCTVGKQRSAISIKHLKHQKKAAQPKKEERNNLQPVHFWGFQYLEQYLTYFYGSG